MSDSVSRRDFVAFVPGACAAATLVGFGRRSAHGSDTEATVTGKQTSSVPPEFPRQEQAQVKEMVTVAHFNVDRVKALLEHRPALAAAAWDWGFGDWETAIGAASHMGRRDIANVLIDAGARPTIFTFAMLGNLDAVRATVETQARLLSLPGPHGISLLAHATAGGSESKQVVAYLQSRNAPAELQTGSDVPQDEHAAIQGVYRFGPAEDERLEVAERRGNLQIRRSGDTPRKLIRVGPWKYHPAGAPGVRIRFEANAKSAHGVTIADAELQVTARRMH